MCKFPVFLRVFNQLFGFAFFFSHEMSTKTNKIVQETTRQMKTIASMTGLDRVSETIMSVANPPAFKFINMFRLKKNTNREHTFFSKNNENTLSTF